MKWIIKYAEREAFAAFIQAVEGDIVVTVEQADGSLTIRPASGRGAFALNIEPEEQS